MNKLKDFIEKIKEADFKSISRAISIVENEEPGYVQLLKNIGAHGEGRLIGITGPPGAGKSTLVNALIAEIVNKGLKVAVVAVDPSSPFNFGSLLGDRIRMSEHYLNPNVFIRSLASRGSLGGLSSKIIEITDILLAAPFDYVIVETVGVGQSEVEIAGLAETTVVVLVPEAGDEIQGIKSGLMEIADIFVVNKSDRDGAELFANNLHKMLHERKHSAWEIPIVSTVASEHKGIQNLLKQIDLHANKTDLHKKKFFLMEKAYQLLVAQRMKDITKKDLLEKIEKEMHSPLFNLYTFLENL